MRIANVIPVTEVEGPGRRSAIWVQGCSIRCPGCCNPEYLEAGGGEERDPEELAATLAAVETEGLTLLGGEPLDQPEEVLRLIRAYRRSSRGIILFTGHTWEQVQANPQWRAIVEQCDLVKAGPFERARWPDARRWIGSANQTLHFITDRYAALARAWEPARREIEIHVRDGEIVINGTPLEEAFEQQLFPTDKPPEKTP